MTEESDHPLPMPGKNGITPNDKGTDHPEVIDSSVLFQGNNEVQITHLQQTYRLRITRQGKLILTK